MIEELLIKKRNYVSVRTIEAKPDVVGYLKKFLDGTQQNGEMMKYLTEDFQKRITDDTQTKIQYDRFTNILKRYVKDYAINEESFRQEGCNYRIDVKFPSKIELIEDKFYRIFLTSCDSGSSTDGPLSLKIDNISYIEDSDDTANLSKLSVDMIMNDDSIGFIELNKENIKYKIKVTGNLSKLEAYKGKKLGLHIHTQGDISDDCKKCGSHYNPTLQFHGDVSGERHLGDLGNIVIDENGTSNFVIYITSFPFPNDILLHKFIGRSVVLHDKEDDLGKGNTLESVKTGDSGKRIACGIMGGIYDV